MRRKSIFALFILGFTSLTSQIILFRELLVVFYGNEISVGVSFASWLLFGGIGSFIGRRYVDKIIKRELLFSIFEIIFGLTLFFTFIFVRVAPRLLSIPVGEIIGLCPMILITLVLLAPFCILNGFLFILGWKIFTQDRPQDIGKAYIFEGLGASAGGFLTSFIFIWAFSSSFIIILLLILCLIVAINFILKSKAAYIVSIGVFSLLVFSSKIENYTLKNKWKGFNILASKNSIYNRITVIKRDNLTNFFVNGVYDFTFPDRYNVEIKSHFPLLQHKNPKDILIISGGASGIIQEILKHNIKTIDYVELDPTIIKLAKEYISETKTLFSNPKVTIYSNMDGRRYIKNTDKSYDIVILNLPEPYTAQLNRFYTKEFFGEVKKILRKDGIFTFNLSSNPNYISTEQKEFYLSLINTLKMVFSEVVVTPGINNFFFASNSKGNITLNPMLLIERLSEREIRADYFKEYYLYTELSKERRNFWNNLLKQKGEIQINLDFRPISYYYDIILFSTYFNSIFKSILRKIKPWHLFFLLCVFYLYILIFILRKKYSKTTPILFSMATGGFSEISLQILILLSFQIIYGYVYYKISIILSSFMFGLILGASIVTKKIEYTTFKRYIYLQGLIVLYPILLLFIILFFSSSSIRLIKILGSEFVFPLVPFFAGFLGGYQFPLANKLYLMGKKDHTKAIGITYGIDLLGSSAGAIIISIFFIPLLGIFATLMALSLINLGSFLLLLKVKPHK